MPISPLLLLRLKTGRLTYKSAEIYTIDEAKEKAIEIIEGWADEDKGFRIIIFKIGQQYSGGNIHKPKDAPSFIRSISTDDLAMVRIKHPFCGSSTKVFLELLTIRSIEFKYANA